MTSSGRWGHVRAHAAALGSVGIASIVGAAAAFAFQILTARLLGTADFGLLAAFFSIVNVAAIGSSALQNSVAVQTAADGEASEHSGWRIPVDALLVGLLGGGVVVAAAPALSTALGASVGVVIAAAVSIPLSFLFAAYVGRIQGAGRATAAVGWSTASLILRVLLAVPALLLGAGVGGAAGAVVAATGVAALGAAFAARRAPSPRRSIFSADGATIMVITIALAWLTSADVFFLRMLAAPDLAGEYASVAVLVKASFILPSTLSLYLLPRFARNRESVDLTRVGVYASIGVSAAAGLVLLLAFWLAGGLVIDIVFSDAYAGAKALLVPIAAAYVPWIILQGLLIQLISDASRPAAAALLVAVGIQAVVFVGLLPDVTAALTAFSALGWVLCGVLVAAMMIKLRRPSSDRSVR
ncbi:O-antigen/teichoic acid export membrane protein [Microbacterium sp. SORGH_AS 1204]|uniref:lipopolysaccharide biosynthesis protein n=1 Tax=Microbacterium sp. SORGH_AS_1204 TaxID=3041785 RepID=UPI002791090A|nr:hypothetical protein [Microbacterium sp. SORGH_AS_1204]MDQ1137590.1 O-antigen/teichoic acid export membrane protein [Microbacterium sp. SORGH_AS_1204]